MQEIVINVPEEIYQDVIKNGFIYDEDGEVISHAIINGAVLPKGHGRLIDEERISLSGIHFKTERDHAMMIGRLNSAPTIIEADRSK